LYDVSKDVLTSDGLRDLSGTCRNLITRVAQENRSLLSEYLLEMAMEGMSKSYRSSAGIWIANLSIFSGKRYKDIVRSDILSFLDSFRMPEVKDPLHKSTGTYNHIRIHIMRFIRWLYHPNISCKDTSKLRPEVIQNIPIIRRKEVFAVALAWVPPLVLVVLLPYMVDILAS
jgi:hypothetical protein